MEERYEAGQATFEEVRDDIQNAMAAPQMEPKVRDSSPSFARRPSWRFEKAIVDSGAAPGKDTTWHDVAEIKPQTTTKEEVAARQKKKFMGVIPYGKAGPYQGIHQCDPAAARPLSPRRPRRPHSQRHPRQRRSRRRAPAQQ